MISGCKFNTLLFENADRGALLISDYSEKRNGRSEKKRLLRKMGVKTEGGTAALYHITGKMQ